jgi:hypothetical protein
MAVVRTQPIEETIELDDGQIVHVTLLRTGFDVGTQEELLAAAEEMPFLSRRAKKLSQAVDKAVEEELPEAEFERRMAELRRFGKKRQNMFALIDLTLSSAIGEWDLCLTEEDEVAGNTIPLTVEAIKALPEALRYDLFAKVSEKIKTRTDSEKKDSPESLPDESAIPKESKEASPVSTPDISLPNVMDSDPTPSSDGALTSSMRLS